jgi:WD40 repeat protein
VRPGGIETSNLTVTQNGIATSAISLDKQWIAVGYYSGRIGLVDARTGTLRNHSLGHRGIVTALAFSPDGKTLASCSNDGTIRLWNVATGLEIMVVEERKGRWINSVAFGLSGTMLAIAGEPLDDGTTVTLRFADTSLIPDTNSQSN